MKKRVSIIVMCALILSMTGCGKEPEPEEPVETTLAVKVASQTMQTTTTTTTTVTTTAPPEPIITDYDTTNTSIDNIEKNVDDAIDLSLVHFNGHWVSINHLNLKDFTRESETQKCSWAAIQNDDPNLYFAGSGFGVAENPADPTSFKGTLLGVECYKNNEPTEIIEGNLESYSIKAVLSSIDNTKEDFEIAYFNGVKVGMTRKEIVELLGAGIETDVENVIETTTTTTTPEEIETVPSESDAETKIETIGPIVTTAPSEEAPTDTTKIATIANAEAPATETTVQEETDNEETTKKKKKKKTNDESDTETTVPEETEPVETTTIDVYAKYSAKMFFKNTNNTLIIIFENGVASRIFLYNNTIPVVQNATD